MNYLKSLVINFLVVFFTNHIFAGIDVVSPTKIPHLGADLPFAIVLGLLNSLIYPILKVIAKPVSFWRIAVVAIGINFIVYALLKVIPIGIHISSLQGYFCGAIVVSIGSFLTNFFEMRAASHHHTQHHHQRHPHSHSSEGDQKQ